MLPNLILSLSLFLHDNNNYAEMRKQRKMGHITFAGPSMGIVEAQLKLMLKEEGSESRTAGKFFIG